MDVIDRLKEYLSTRRGAVTSVARIAGVNHTTVLRIATGITRNPGFRTLQAIERALDELEAKTEAATP